MVDRRFIATGVLALAVAMSQVIAGRAQGQGAPAPQGRGAAPPQGQAAPGAGTPQGDGRGAGGPGGAPGRGGPGGAAGGRGGRGGAYTPPAGSKELKDVLYNWAWHMGMLRSGAESELVKTLDYYGAGGMFQVNGQPCTVTTTLHMQVNYQLPGYRVQYECTLPNKQTVKNVEVMSGDYAWDDDIPGAELVAGKGKSTPRPATLTERRIRLWASPHGAVKAAIAAAAGMSTAESFGENPATLLDRQAAAGVKGTTTLTWEGEKAVVKFPMPDVPGATATATLVNYLPERVVVTNGKDTTEFVYSNWADWNNPLFKIEALYAGTIVERKNGMVVRNMTAKVTEIGQVYVIVPVPESIKKAGK